MSATPIPPSSASSAQHPASDSHEALRSSAGLRPFSKAERLSIGVLTLVQASVFAWGYVLPWDKLGIFVAWCSLLSAVHLLTAAAFLWPRCADSWRARSWAVGSACALSFLLWATWAVATSGVYLSRLYGGLGQGLSAALVAIWGLIAFVVLPPSVWGLCRTRPVWRRLTRASLPTLLVLACALSVSLTLTANAAHTAPVHPTEAADEHLWQDLLTQRVAPVVSKLRVAPEPEDASKGVPLDRRARAKCEQPLDQARTLIVHYVNRAGKGVASCLQSGELAELAESLRQTLRSDASRGPILIDRVTGTREPARSPAWLEALSLRPALDGACLDDRCYTPWQLVAQRRFIEHSPLPFLADLKFGVSLLDVAKALLGKSRRDAGEAVDVGSLVAWSSQSTALGPRGELTPLRRMHPPERAVDRQQVETAAAAFETHILTAQKSDGQFRYTLDPFTGGETRQVNLARQAGTLFALCDIGSSSPAVTKAARLGLAFLVKRRLKHDEYWALAQDSSARVVRLGESALPLIALLSCRSRVGDVFDEAITQLSRFLLHLQRKDGSFATDFEWRRKEVVDLGEALYAPGQALLALVLLDNLLAEHPELGHLGDSAQLTDAIQRGMTHVARKHWDVPIYSFFFVEENWNCLTARAALTRHRNDAYERFCLDYAKFKSRLILTKESRVAPEYIGGFGFGNIIPPHNTGAAGFGEALAAAIEVARVRSEDSEEFSSVMHDLVGFLLRQQWTQETCAACSPAAVGSLSEHLHSPITRIDFAQHAYAAVSHGAQVLGLWEGT
jgi:hypothetical protein